MNRCVSLMASAWAVSLALGAPAAAQSMRHFPANALRGDLNFAQPPEVLLNGEPARLAPGARIRGDHNLLVLPGSLTGSTLRVHYTVEAGSGLLKDIWLLTPAEAAKRPWPVTLQQAQQWQFDHLGQTWTKP